MDGQAGALSQDESEITPEMIEAGVRVLRSFDPNHDGVEATVREIIAQIEVARENR